MRRTKAPIQRTRPRVTVEVEDMRLNVDKSLYSENIPERVHTMARLGLTILQMSQSIGVAKITLDKWLANKPEVRQAYDKGKEVFDHGVALAIQQRALGYEYEEIKHVDGIDVNGRPYQYTTRTTKWIPPDVNAGKFWLKNRDPEHWREEQGTNNTLIVNTTENRLNLEVLNEDERKLLRSAAIKTLSSMNGINSG